MDSIEQTNFLKLSASNTYPSGTDGQHITKTLSTEIKNSHNKQLSADFYFVNLDPVVTFQTKLLNIYIQMKETNLYVARIFYFCTQSLSDVTGFATNLCEVSLI